MITSTKSLLSAVILVASAAFLSACTEPDLPDLGPPADGGALQSSPPPAQPAH